MALFRSLIPKGRWHFILFSICIINFCTETEERHLFFRGRTHNGFLGYPRKSGSQNLTLPPETWFEQRLDHFNPTDAKTWQQRYYTNASFHVTGGPVFLLIGGESEASASWMVEGQWMIYAKKYKALCFQLEHRFYGRSHPTRSLTTKSLQYLTSSQALADLANFIKKMTIKYELDPHTTKWIVFGGSYPGSLAAWMRAKYSHLVHGAVSGSAPLLAKADFKEYLRVVKDDLSNSNKTCVAAIEEANKQLHTLMKTAMGQETVNNIFRLCDPIDVLEEKDIASLYETLSSMLAGVAQYSGDNREGSGALSINTLCKTLTDESKGTPAHRYAAVIDLILTSEGEECLDYKYDNIITKLTQVDWETEEALNGDRQWVYQTCTEFGFYQTSSLTTDLFGDEFKLDYFVQQCSDIFGPRYNKEQLMRGIEITNTRYGALNIEASRVVYVHGSLDPWHALGITKTVQQDSPAIFIKGTSHCADMYSPSPSDPPQLISARNMIDDLIGLWLDEE